MTLRIFKLSDWQLLNVGQDLDLLLDTPGRKVTIKFNTVLPTRIGWHLDGSESDVLLGVIEGQDDVEFRPNGSGKVTVQSDGEVWFYTDDGSQTVAGDGNEQESYRKLLEPRDRSEVLERIIEKQNATHNRLLAAQAGERAALLERIAAQEAALKEAERAENASGVVATDEQEANSSAGSASDAGKTGKGAKLPAAE